MRKVGQVALPQTARPDAWQAGKVLGRHAVDIAACRLIKGRDHHLATHQGGSARDTLNRAQSGYCGGIIRKALGQIALLIGMARGINRDMGIGPQDRIDKFRPEPRAHRQSGDQRKDGQGDADKADPRHHRHAALGPPCAQIAPSDHEFKGCKGAGGQGLGLSEQAKVAATMRRTRPLVKPRCRYGRLSWSCP